MEIKEKMTELYQVIEAFSQGKERLAEENIILKKRIEDLESKINKTTNQCTSIGLIDLDNKIKEAEYNTLLFFDKNCPYCGNGIFDGHIRNKSNIDHFWPIAKGGQHVPWNILPVCGRCNKKKKDKLPFEFLETVKYTACLNYLESVKKKYSNETQTCVEMIAKIKGSILNEGTLSAREVAIRLYNILEAQELHHHGFEGSDKYKFKEDYLVKFVEDCCIIDLTAEVKFSEIYSIFEAWWQTSKSQQPPRKKMFSMVLARQFKKEKRGGTVFFSGLKIKPRR